MPGQVKVKICKLFSVIWFKKKYMYKEVLSHLLCILIFFQNVSSQLCFNFFFFFVSVKPVSGSNHVWLYLHPATTYQCCTMYMQRSEVSPWTSHTQNQCCRWKQTDQVQRGSIALSWFLIRLHNALTKLHEASGSFSEGLLWGQKQFSNTPMLRSFWSAKKCSGTRFNASDCVCLAGLDFCATRTSCHWASDQLTMAHSAAHHFYFA